MNEAYIIFYDDMIYKDNGRIGVYTSIQAAERVVEEDSKVLASHICINKGIRWCDLSFLKKAEYIDQVKEKFKINKFVKEKEKII